jgi:hypothetical protein
MEIIMRGVNDITPYEHNPRRNDDAVDAVAASIKEFGFKVPIVIDKDGIIVAGHTRLKAAKKLGMEQVPCIVADDLTDEQIKAFRLADNKVAELADWDFSELETELSDIDMDMSQFGFEGMMEFPEQLDDDSVASNEMAAKITFRTYDDYETWESELKQIAEQAGAVFSCVKA